VASTDDALPYLVLEYIDGVPVDWYCHSVASRRDSVSSCFVADRRCRRLRPPQLGGAPGPQAVQHSGASDGAVKLLDFGVAKLLEQHAPGARPTTRTGQRWMTPDYAAPEQIRGKPITRAPTVYQLGAVLYELLAGSHAVWRDCGETIHELERAVLEARSGPR
jgi:serine/threonine-protein kinase